MMLRHLISERDWLDQQTRIAAELDLDANREVKLGMYALDYRNKEHGLINLFSFIEYHIAYKLLDNRFETWGSNMVISYLLTDSAVAGWDFENKELWEATGRGE
jgi:hypothetical protein